MLQPLNVTAPPASLSLSTETSDRSDAPQTPLARVCQVEYIAIRTKTEREKQPSELFFCAPGRVNAMLTPTWRIGSFPEGREPDKLVYKTFREIFHLHDEVKALVAKCEFGRQRCQLCTSLFVFIRDRAVGWHVFNRMLMSDDLKFKLMQKVVGKFLFFLVRAQRPTRPNAPFVPSCANQAQLVALLVAFLEL